MSDRKRVVFIIAEETFRDEELFDTQAAIEAGGIETVVASSIEGTCIGKLGGQAEATMLVGDILVDDFDAIVFVGGAGAVQYYDDQAALSAAKDAAAKGKVLAAICIAPRILANAGLLKGVKATCFESEAEALKKAGAEFIETTVVKGGKIITGSGPHAATEFGQTIAAALGVD